MANKQDEGRWVTIGGRKVFIKNENTIKTKKEEKPDLQKAINEHYENADEEKQRLNIAMDIAREIHGKHISDTVAERYARDLMQYQEGDVLDDGEETYKGKNGIELSTKALKEWLADLKGEEETEDWKPSKDISDKPTGTILNALHRYGEQNNLDFERLLLTELRGGQLSKKDEIKLADMTYRKVGKSWEAYKGDKKIWTGTNNSLAGEIARHFEKK